MSVNFTSLKYRYPVLLVNNYLFALLLWGNRLLDDINFLCYWLKEQGKDFRSDFRERNNSIRKLAVPLRVEEKEAADYTVSFVVSK